MPKSSLHGSGRGLLVSNSQTQASGVASSMDSDLEAFSHNPAVGRFGPMASQTGPNTNYLNERFLSY
ncbi:hypothetical protein METBIDRAFT_48180 [Metschnikowia bicuspidata var. bicuspidata NRRL YB-4993]|uniref:Uncharacterized protein n=1 Tax=Metschnikowia bicuspidata var. bicuspidata NRRL YB-4993 TaxID=869754 RepID=A0A1A0GWK6_9ASCO|nr:hypothetical protein METBIDRAFT_48180 [Metschnikowia bicuspidata var. bicuspidata NRRL YB-4993]OBA16113.1 hypothetical protein METBIDRAFT_48180 [Metschnikowia bicuspidata var. bicuspidata NRRL YB-4993]